MTKEEIENLKARCMLFAPNISDDEEDLEFIETTILRAVPELIAMVERRTKILDKKHLCDGCNKSFATCDPLVLKFGTGKGNDNVIECSGLEHKT